MSKFTPEGYQKLNDWIADEVVRRGYKGGLKPIPDAIYWEAFDEIANFLGKNDSSEHLLVKCIDVHGIEWPLPARTWRTPPELRAKMSSGIARLTDKYGFRTFEARIFIRRDLRLDAVPAAAPATSKISPTKPRRKPGPKALYIPKLTATLRRIREERPDIYASSPADIVRYVRQLWKNQQISVALPKSDTAAEDAVRRQQSAIDSQG